MLIAELNGVQVISVHVFANGLCKGTGSNGMLWKARACQECLKPSIEACIHRVSTFSCVILNWYA